MIKKGLDCHPFDGNWALEGVEEDVSVTETRKQGGRPHPVEFQSWRERRVPGHRG